MRRVLVCALLALPPVAASAQEAPRFVPYFRAGGGAFWPMSADIRFNGNAGEIDYETGVGGFAALGVAGEAFRIEVEGVYLTADIAGFEPEAGGDVPIVGDLEVLAGFLNGYLSLPLAPRWDAVAGGGIGVARQRARIDAVGGIPVSAEESETDIAANGAAGLEYDVDGLRVGALYRFYWVGNGDNGLEGTTAHALAATVTLPLTSRR